MLSLIIILTAFGIFMIASEVILPGGFMGIGGAVAIVVALILTFVSPELDHIGAGGRLLLSGGILVGSGIALALWLKFFTRASFVKNHLLDEEIGGKATFEKYSALLDLTGRAETDLRPAGKARLDGRKHDVLAENGMIEAGTEVKVIKVEGSRVVVRPLA